jgi:hypothetical protein
VLAEGKLALPPLTRVERGGVIVARDIEIQGAVPAPARGALVLVATDGRITLPGPDVPVHASLLALKGAVAPRGGTDLTGNIVARRLDLEGLTSAGAGAKPGHVRYDHARLKVRPFDPAAAARLGLDVSRRIVRVD